MPSAVALTSILEALGKLDSGQSVHFEGTRDGRPLQLDYELRQ